MTAPDAANDNDAPDRAALLDRHVGARILERRTMLGISQQQLAATIGVSYRQAHQYERGHSQVSADRLRGIAEALAVPVSWFFEAADAAGRTP